MSKEFQAIVVGAGPAGSSAALTMARAGLDVALVERGNFPGEKNMFGGLLHRMTSIEEVFPDFWERAPLERHIAKKGTTFMTDAASFHVQHETASFDRTPYNGYTVFRPKFDRWLAEEAVKAGVTLINRSTVEDVVLKNNRVQGVTIVGRQGKLSAPVVVAADGVLSFTALKAGLRRPGFNPDQMAVGIKALFDLPKEVIDDRFGLVRDQGFANEYVGCTGGVRGGGFLYTNYDTISVGLVVHLSSLRASGKTPYDLLNAFLEQPQFTKLLKGGRLMEYSAHVIPEGGYAMIPELYGDGILVAGDAAALCNATGVNLEGINLASHSGILAAKTVVEAHAENDFSRKALKRYKDRLDLSWVMKDLKGFRNAPKMLHIDRIYNEYPELVCSMMEHVYRIDGTPKVSIPKLIMREVKEKVGIKNAFSDLLTAWRAL
ncbi:FAD-dependent oxidoreductase [Geobacter pelophilus]|uniref:FAD-dependent oxidoreductase n=1 Tax=Geoanaerobacter pelophilus TaxID=60036 RepID=A0AAW4L980_9BACT|nr:FAD-dependent oxidoreductase [Geoanaerobacter pelophilus]MBT0665125.1 FAD-dependent oxidoreductase [Geoanaerobacter pelophilus]